MTPRQIAEKHVHARQWDQQTAPIVDVCEQAINEMLAQDVALDDDRLFIPVTLHLERVKALETERDALAAWKKSALTVESWWKRIDDFVRTHPDVLLGRNVSHTALAWLKERDDLKAKNATMTKQLVTIYSDETFPRTSLFDEITMQRQRADIIAKEDRIKALETTIADLRLMVADQNRPIFDPNGGGGASTPGCILGDLNVGSGGAP